MTRSALEDANQPFFWPIQVMPKTLTIEVPDDAFSALRTSPEEFARELRLAAAIKWYEMERISQGKAAELAGLSRAAFVEALAQYDVSAIQASPGELEEDARVALSKSSDREDE